MTIAPLIFVTLGFGLAFLVRSRPRTRDSIISLCQAGDLLRLRSGRWGHDRRILTERGKHAEQQTND